MKMRLVSAQGRRRNVRWEQRRVMRYVSSGTTRRGWATAAARASGVPADGGRNRDDSTSRGRHGRRHGWRGPLGRARPREPRAIERREDFEVTGLGSGARLGSGGGARLARFWGAVVTGLRFPWTD